MEVDPDKVSISKFFHLFCRTEADSVMREILSSNPQEDILVTGIRVEQTDDSEKALETTAEVIIKGYFYSVRCSLWKHLYPCINSESLRKKLIVQFA